MSEPMRFINYYHCDHPDEHRAGYGEPPSEWSDEWSCMCNDKCPVCNLEIEPYESEELDEDGNVLDEDVDMNADTISDGGGAT